MPARTWILSLALPLALLLGACTRADVDRGRIGSGHFEITGKAGCVGFCPPDRRALLAQMHAHCPEGSVPAILSRRFRKNGLIGAPHTTWRFECLFAPGSRGAQIAETPGARD